MTIDWTPDIQKGEEPLYLTIVRALANDISSGALDPDNRLPTHRELADKLGVAIGTITRAYTEAELRGLIRGDGRRGTFVGGRRAGKKSALSTLAEADNQAINLSANHPTYREDPDLAAALRRLARRQDVQQLLQYTPSPGYSRHRAAGAEWLKSLGADVSPESIIITVGAQHGLLVIFMTIAARGDLILAEEHTYPGVKAIAERLGLQLNGIAADKDGIIPDALESLCRQKKVRALYCNPTLQNPTNSIIPEERRRRIAEIAEKYDFIIVEDEILRPLVNNPPPLISSMVPDRSLLVISPSKVITPGLRIGYLSAPARYLQKLIDCQCLTNLNTAALPAEILASWIEDGTAEEIIKRRRQENNRRYRLAMQLFENHEVYAHETGCYLWLHLPEEWGDMEFIFEAHRRGVLTAPSEIFAVGNNKKLNAVRIALSTTPRRETLKAGLEILAGILTGQPGPKSVTV